MIISIDGFDGVGKTTICNELSSILGIKHIEKPLLSVFDNNKYEKYEEMRSNVYLQKSQDLNVSFIAFNNMLAYTQHKNETFLIDRFAVTNFSWCVNEHNIAFYKAMIEQMQDNLCCFILKLKTDELVLRLKTRNVNDKDLMKIGEAELQMEKMISLAKIGGFKYEIIDVADKKPKEIAYEIVGHLTKWGII